MINVLSHEKTYKNLSRQLYNSVVAIRASGKDGEHNFALEVLTSYCTDFQQLSRISKLPWAKFL